jgi:hypothetical protein
LFGFDQVDRVSVSAVAARQGRWPASGGQYSVPV